MVLDAQSYITLFSSLVSSTGRALGGGLDKSTDSVFGSANVLELDLMYFSS